MQDYSQQIAVFDDRPFFERALAYGVRNGIIEQKTITSILNDAPKGMVQIAEYFGTQYLRPNIEEARARIVSLVSLFLEDRSGGDLEIAARSLRDNTFLSHSRGGSEMLKSLWAMPEDDSFGILLGQSQKQFLAVWSLRNLNEYRQALAERQGHASSIAAALWFAERLGLAASSLSTVTVESVIRTAMLVYLGGNMPASIPNAAGFIGILGVIRKKGIPAKARKRLKELFEALPEACAGVARRVLAKVETEDLPRVLDASRPMNQLICELEPLYTGVALTWPTGSLAADTPPRHTLSKPAARALVRKVRAEGFRRAPVLGFIRDLAPYQMQEDLEALWNEFFPEAEGYLLDATDTTLGEALAFLKENCVVL
jgi:hypothetical protein